MRERTIKGPQALAVAIAAGYESLSRMGAGGGLETVSLDEAEALVDSEPEALRLVLDTRSDHRAMSALPAEAQEYAAMVYDFLPLVDLDPIEEADPEDLDHFGLTDTEWMVATAAALHDRLMDGGAE